MKAIDFGDDKTFIKNYEKLKSSRKMGELYGCDKKTITSHAKKIGYDYSHNREIKIFNQPPEEVAQLYEKLKSTKKVAEHYGCSNTAVNNFLKQHGYEVKNTRNKLSGIVKDEDFIKLYDELKSADKVAEYYECSATAVLNYAKKIGYDVNSNKNYNLSDKDRQKILDSYESKTSCELAEEYQVSPGFITKIWRENGLTYKPKKPTRTIDLTGKTFGYWTVLNKTNRRTASGGMYWHCRCKCGIEKDVSSLSLCRGTSLSCGAHSNISKGNEKIKDLLMRAKIPFETEKKFSTCKDKKELPFDFYVDDKYLIEYDGIQHFQDSIFDYEYTHSHDLIKNEWCKQNNIPLIRIPYTQYDVLSLNDLMLETSKFIQSNADYKLGKIGKS